MRTWSPASCSIVAPTALSEFKSYAARGLLQHYRRWNGHPAAKSRSPSLTERTVFRRFDPDQVGRLPIMHVAAKAKGMSNPSQRREFQMHFAISATYGPTDPTRAMLPFIFAASAVQSDDQVTLMLFADSVLMAVEGVGAKLVPVGPPNKYEEIAGNPNVTLMACKPCMEARGLTAQVIDKRVKLAGMNEFHAATKRQDVRVVNF